MAQNFVARDILGRKIILRPPELDATLDDLYVSEQVDVAELNRSYGPVPDDVAVAAAVMAGLASGGMDVPMLSSVLLKQRTDHVSLDGYVRVCACLKLCHSSD